MGDNRKVFRGRVWTHVPVMSCWACGLMADAQQNNDAFELSYSEEEMVIDTRSELRGTYTACISRETAMQCWL